MIKAAKKIWLLLKETILKFIEDNPMSYSAAIAFYTIFSLPGILLVTVSIAGSAYDQQLVQEELINQIRLLVGPQSASEINDILKNIDQQGDTTVAKAVGILILLFSATTVFVSLQEALNRIWGIKPKPKRGFLKLIVDRILSLAMIMSIGFLLLVSLIVDAILVIFKSEILSYFESLAPLLITTFNVFFSLGVITLVFGAIFKVLPDAKVSWRDVSIGAFITTLLFTLGKYLISFYLGNSSLGSTYGAAGSLVLMLIWIYYSVTILLLGAEFTFIYSKHIGSFITPGKSAVKVVLKEEEKGKERLNE